MVTISLAAAPSGRDRRMVAGRLSAKGWRVLVAALLSGALMTIVQLRLARSGAGAGAGPGGSNSRRRRDESPPPPLLLGSRGYLVASSSSSSLIGGEPRDRALADGADDVDVSVIILTYKKFGALSKLLPSVIRQRHSSPFEIIIADNGCFPDTREVIDRAFSSSQSSTSSPAKSRRGHLAHHVKLCDNPGYSAGNNAAVKLASSSSRYLLFLNDDIVLTRPTFLKNLVDLVERKSPKAVAAGCKLVDAGGTELIEAGSMIFADASAHGYGRGDRNPYRGEYTYPRPVDYVSGACLLVEKAAFEGYVHKDGDGGGKGKGAESYGFDGATFPNYYEDTDLQIYFQHGLGREVWFQPRSVARHEEHGSFGKDESVAMMKKAKKKFAEKWGKELETGGNLHVRGVKSNDIATLHIQGADLRSRDPEVANILYIDDRPPNKLRGAGYGRAFDNLSMITELGHRVTITALEQRDGFCDGPCLDELTTDLGVEYVFGSTSKLFESRAGYYDLVLVSRPLTLEKFQEQLRHFYYDQPFALIYDCEALGFRRAEMMRNLVENEGIQFPGRLELFDSILDQSRSEELALIDRGDVVIAVSDNEKSVIEELAKDAKNIQSIGHIMENNPLPNSFDDRGGILFLGAFHSSMFYNGDAIWYFLTEIYPLVIEETRGISLTIVGRGIPEKLRSVVDENKDISRFVTFVDSPPSIRHYYAQSRILIAPHLYGAGIQYKVSEALSIGLPVVMSSFTHKSFGNVPGCVGSDNNAFKQCIISVHNNEKKWKALRQEGLDFIAETHSRKKVMEKWSSIINSNVKLARERRRKFQKGQQAPSPLMVQN